jgi:O-palmitoleoyl-L-serine hydrolase
MYFVGGAACGAPDVGQTLYSCYQRSKIHLGSSIYWPKTNLFGGILSNDPNKNIFANWTKAVFLYCDGAFHQGYAKSPIKYKDTSLYFRGAAITRSHFKYMDSYFSFKAADKVVLTGSSAGGMATFVWADYLKGMLGAQT